MFPNLNDTSTPFQTTLGELAAAYYEAALAELGDEALASEVSAKLVARAMKQRNR